MSAEASGVVSTDPSGHVVNCGFCGELAFGVTQGKWSNAGDAYTEVIYRHHNCPAVDPAARSARPQLITAPPRRRRLLAGRRTPRSI